MQDNVKRLISELVERASVDWNVDEASVSTVNVIPEQAGACGFSVAWSAHEIIVGFDDQARIELGPGKQDLPLLRQVVSAIVSGRVVRLEGARRSSYRMVLGDGSVLVADDGGVLTRLGSRREVPCQPY